MIQQLEALSRTRALDDGESHQLQKLITVERRYLYSAKVHRDRPVQSTTLDGAS